jgi:hypothetical protein
MKFSICIAGESGTGKSSCLQNLREPEKVLYLNCEGKALPFPSKFIEKYIQCPLQIYEALAYADQKDHINLIIIDSQTYLMNMVKSKYEDEADDTWSTWKNYFKYFDDLMLKHVNKCSKPVIFTAHTVTKHEKLDFYTKIPTSGQLSNQGIESYFTSVIYTKKIDTSLVEKANTNLINITEEERDYGLKHVFQTRPTRETKNDAIKSPQNLFSKEETYIDNDLQLVLDRMKQFYNY